MSKPSSRKEVAAKREAAKRRRARQLVAREQQGERTLTQLEADLQKARSAFDSGDLKEAERLLYDDIWYGSDIPIHLGRQCMKGRGAIETGYWEPEPNTQRELAQSWVEFYAAELLCRCSWLASNGYCQEAERLLECSWYQLYSGWFAPPLWQAMWVKAISSCIDDQKRQDWPDEKPDMPYVSDWEEAWLRHRLSYVENATDSMDYVGDEEFMESGLESYDDALKEVGAYPYSDGFAKRVPSDLVQERWMYIEEGFIRISETPEGWADADEWPGEIATENKQQMWAMLDGYWQDDGHLLLNGFRLMALYQASGLMYAVGPTLEEIIWPQIKIYYKERTGREAERPGRIDYHIVGGLGFATTPEFQL